MPHSNRPRRPRNRSLTWRWESNRRIRSPLLSVSCDLPKGWYLTTSPLITADWEASDDNRWTLPIGGGIGRIFKIGRQPINANLTAYYNVLTPDDVGANWQLRAQWTFLFPTH